MPYHGFAQSGAISLPPLCAIILEPESPSEPARDLSARHEPALLAIDGVRGVGGVALAPAQHETQVGLQRAAVLPDERTERRLEVLLLEIREHVAQGHEQRPVAPCDAGGPAGFAAAEHPASRPHTTTTTRPGQPRRLANLASPTPSPPRCTCSIPIPS